MQKRALDTRDALLQAALKLFTERGFHGTPTALIAKEAGVATGTLFHYFATKEELINQLYLEIKQEMHRALSAGISSDQTSRMMTYTLWRNFIVWMLDNPTKLQFFNQFSSSPYISALTHGEAMQHANFLYDLIEEGKRRDVLKQMPTELLLDVSTGITLAMGMHFLRHPAKFQDDQYREMAFTAYWDCIKR